MTIDTDTPTDTDILNGPTSVVITTTWEIPGPHATTLMLTVSTYGEKSEAWIEQRWNISNSIGMPPAKISLGPVPGAIDTFKWINNILLHTEGVFK